MTTATTGGLSARDTLAGLRRHGAPSVALAAKLAGRGAVEVSASGCEVHLSDGRRMLDFGSYAVPLLGHRHPQVVAAVQAQLDRMPTATRVLANPIVARAAQTMAEYLGEPWQRVWFGSDGADAVECAIKLARVASGRRTVVCVRGGFHGKTLGALSVTDNPRLRAGLDDLMPGVLRLDPADPRDFDAVRRCAAAGDLAAVVFEPIQGENGVRTLPADVLRRWTQDARQAGAFVIADEVQVGLRRAGERSVAVAAGLAVDAVLFGKALGGGVMPVSAVLATDQLFHPMLQDGFLHTSTFGGHPLALAAVPATVQAVESLADHGRSLQDLIGAGLVELRRDYPDLVREVRGQGLIWGVDFRSAAVAGEVLVAVAEHGLLVSPCLTSPQTLRLLPSLVCGPEHVRRALGIVRTALGSARTARPDEVG